MYLLTTEEILNLMERGKADYEAGCFGPLEIAMEYNDFIWCNAAYAAGKDIAEGRWTVDFDLTEKTWERIGCPSIHPNWDTYLRSHNFRDDSPEPGVSVIDDEWKQRINFAWWKDSISERGIWEIKGIQCGWGSDGEPVIIPTSQAIRKS